MRKGELLPTWDCEAGYGPVFTPARGSNWGYSGFSRDQNNCDSSGAYLLQCEGEYKHA